MTPKSFRVRGFCTLLALAGALMGASGHAAEGAGPKNSYFGAGYEWTDVKYAVKESGEKHDGYKIEGSLGLFDWLHVYGEAFDGDFSGTLVDGGPSEDVKTKGFHLGLGVSYPLTDSWDAVLRAAYVDVEQSSRSLTIDDDGYMVEGMVRAMASDRAEIFVGYSYTDIDESDIDNRDAFVGLVYSLSDIIALKAKGIVFDDDTGFELGVRVYFGDSLF